LWEEIAGQMMYPIYRMEMKILGTCTSSISMQTFSKIRGSSLKNCGRSLPNNDVPYIKYVLSFLKND
jgi:hypothetical protein